MTESKAIELLEYIRETGNGETPYVGCAQNIAIEMAINALEKQIPKKLKIEQWIDTKCDCGYEFSKHRGDGYYSIPLENKTKYCPNCGQKLDWKNNV